MLLSKNPERFLPGQWPTYFKSSKGCKIRDLDGNLYYDFSLMGIGTNILGYSNSFVDNGIKKIIKKGKLNYFKLSRRSKTSKNINRVTPLGEQSKISENWWGS